MKTRAEILSFLRESNSRFAELYGVRRIGIFGSVSRGDAEEYGDVDVLVEMSSPTFDKYMDLKFELESVFGASVDLVLKETLKERIRSIVEKEVTYA
jgi:uncharacterized protein